MEIPNFPDGHDAGKRFSPFLSGTTTKCLNIDLRAHSVSKSNDPSGTWTHQPLDTSRWETIETLLGGASCSLWGAIQWPGSLSDRTRLYTASSIGWVRRYFPDTVAFQLSYIYQLV